MITLPSSKAESNVEAPRPSSSSAMSDEAVAGSSMVVAVVVSSSGHRNTSISSRSDLSQI